VTAAALPLLTAGTLLSTTDAANAATQNNGQNGTTLNAIVSAGLTQDKTYAWDVTKTAEPASLDIWKGDAGKWSLGEPDRASLKVHVGEQASYSVPVAVTATTAAGRSRARSPSTTRPPIKADISDVMDTFPGAQIADPIPTSLASGETVVLHFTLQPGSGQAGTNHVEVKLSNGTVFGADAAFDLSNAQVKEVEKTATITNHAEIKVATAARSARTARSMSPGRDQPPPGPGTPDASRSRPASVIAYRGPPQPLPPASARPSCSSFFSHRSVVIRPDSEPSSSRAASRLDTPPGRASSIASRPRVLQAPRRHRIPVRSDVYTSRDVSCAKRERTI
jgi:hypothetical protein